MKPEKKKYDCHGEHDLTCGKCHKIYGYNQAIDDMEKWIEEAPLEGLIYDCFPQDDKDFKNYNSNYTQEELRQKLEDSIRKLLKGEKDDQV